MTSTHDICEQPVCEEDVEGSSDSPISLFDTPTTAPSSEAPVEDDGLIEGSKASTVSFAYPADAPASDEDEYWVELDGESPMELAVSSVSVSPEAVPYSAPRSSYVIMHKERIPVRLW